MLVVAVLVERGRYAAAGAVVCPAEGEVMKLTAVEAKHVARAIGRNAAWLNRPEPWDMRVRGYILWRDVQHAIGDAKGMEYAEEGRAMHAASNTNNSEGKS